MRTFQDSFYNVWARHDSTNSTYTTIESQKPAIEKFLDDELGEIKKESPLSYGHYNGTPGSYGTNYTSFASSSPLTIAEIERFKNMLNDSFNS